MRFAFNYAGLDNHAYKIKNVVLGWVVKRSARAGKPVIEYLRFKRSLALFPNHCLLRQLLLLEKVNET
jgi:hypothetical protein